MNIRFIIDLWCIGTILLVISIMITVLSLLKATFKKIELKKPKGWFDDASNLRDEQARLVDHGNRILGTLIYYEEQSRSS